MINQAPISYCRSCGKPEHGSIACNTVLLDRFDTLKPAAIQLAKASTPLDQLSERLLREVECGPEHGKGEFGLPAPKWCSRCNGTGTILDPRWAALREALLLPCIECLVFIGECILPTSPFRACNNPQHKGHMLVGREYCGDCKGTGFVRRSRAESADILLNAAKPIMEAEGWFLVPQKCGWEIWRSSRTRFFHVVGVCQPTPADALSTAMLIWMDAQEKVKA